MSYQTLELDVGHGRMLAIAGSHARADDRTLYQTARGERGSDVNALPCHVGADRRVGDVATVNAVHSGAIGGGEENRDFDHSGEKGKHA